MLASLQRSRHFSQTCVSIVMTSALSHQLLERKPALPAEIIVSKRDSLPHFR